jgi:glyoxylase I family protein
LAFSNPQVNLYAADIERSLRFYQDVLGLPEAFRTPKEGVPAHVELKLGSLRLGVATFQALERDHGMHTGPGPPRGELVLFTKDVDGAYAWATRRGAPPVSPPHDFAGALRSARVADPDGNPVAFTARLPTPPIAERETPPTFQNHLFNLYARDLARSLELYRDTLGFTETFRAPGPGPSDHVEMELGPLNLGVSTLEALQRDHGLSGGGGPPRAEVVLWVDEADAAFAWLTARGVPALSPPHHFAGVLRAAWVADPDGNPIQIVARAAGP